MQKNSKTDMVSWILFIGALLLLFEFAFFDGGPIFLLMITSICIYFGRKKTNKRSGKILFWFGIFMLIITVINSLTFKFLIFAGIIYLVIQFSQAKKNPNRITPVLIESVPVHEIEPLIKKQPFFETKIFSRQNTREHVFEWNDVNIQSGIGDTIIDLSNTVLPNGESVIFIRNIIGNVQIFIPYEVEVNINHSIIFGSVSIFGNFEEKIINQTLMYQTENFDASTQRLKIVTSMIIGDIEVRRI
jgi:lia operon protein LiaF